MALVSDEKEPDVRTSVDLQTKVFRRAVKNAVRCTESAGTVIDTVELTVELRDEKCALKMVATNRYILLIQWLDVIDTPPLGPACVPLDRLADLLRDANDRATVRLAFSDDGLTVDDGDIAVMLKKRAEDFPNYHTLFKQARDRAAVAGEFTLGEAGLAPLASIHDPNKIATNWTFRGIGDQTTPLYATAGRRGSTWSAEMLVMPVRVS